MITLKLTTTSLENIPRYAESKLPVSVHMERMLDLLIDPSKADAKAQRMEEKRAIKKQEKIFKTVGEKQKQVEFDGGDAVVRKEGGAEE